MRDRIEEIINNRWLLFALRLVLGGIFIAASVSKLQHQAEFVATVSGYGLLPATLAQFYGFAVPWVELFIGCSLILGIFSRFVSAVSILLIISFVVASAYRLFNPAGGGCGCFGELFALSYPASLSLDAVMLFMALILLLNNAKEEVLGIRSVLSRYNPVSERRGRLILEKVGKLAVVAVAMAIVIPFIGGGQASLDTEKEVDNTTELNSVPASISYDREIDSALEQGKPVFLYFYIVGCPPCEEQKPVINGLMRKYGERVVFLDVIMGGSNVAQEFNVKDSPSMLLINGKNDEGEYVVYQRFGGVTELESLEESIERVLR